MELLIAGVIILGVVASATFIVLKTQETSKRGWEKALEATHQVRLSQTVRISTLENRLLAGDWQEFDALQRVPDEAAKEAFSEKSHAESEAYDPGQEAFLQRLINQGEDLEGDNTDDYEPSGAILG